MRFAREQTRLELRAEAVILLEPGANVRRAAEANAAWAPNDVKRCEETEFGSPTEVAGGGPPVGASSLTIMLNPA